MDAKPAMPAESMPELALDSQGSFFLRFPREKYTRLNQILAGPWGASCPSFAMSDGSESL